MLRHVYRVLPAHIRFGHSIPIDHLELKSMKMKRMIHSNDVLHLPDLHVAELCCFVDAHHVVELSVDESLLKREVACALCECRIDLRNNSQLCGNHRRFHSRL